MTLRTPLCELLGIDVPVVQAPIGSSSTPELAAAVSEAGGLGMLAQTWFEVPEVRDRLRRARSLTGRPVGVNLVLDLPIQDCTAGFKCFRRETLEALDLDGVKSNGYGFQVEMNHLCNHAGFRIVEVPIVFPDRAAGRSKMSWGIFLEAATLVWKLRSHPHPRTTTQANRRTTPSYAAQIGRS